MKMLDELKRIMDHKKMVSIYGDECDHDYHFVGYIQAVDDNGLLLSKQNYGGYNNGFVFFTNIIFFETDTPDTKRHEKLFKLRNIEPNVLNVNSDNYLLEEVLKICLEKHLCCDIFKKENDEGDSIGFISEIYEEFIVLKCIDKYGADLGKRYIEKNDIYRIFIEGEYEEAARILYDDKHKK